MVQFKEFIMANWPTIIEYFLIAVGYVVVQYYKGNITTAKRDLSVLFKEKTTKVDNDLAESKQAYQAAINEIADLKAQVARHEKALHALTMNVEEVLTDADVFKDESN